MLKKEAAKAHTDRSPLNLSNYLTSTLEIYKSRGSPPSSGKFNYFPHVYDK